MPLKCNLVWLLSSTQDNRQKYLKNPLLKIKGGFFMTFLQKFNLKNFIILKPMDSGLQFDNISLPHLHAHDLKTA